VSVTAPDRWAQELSIARTIADEACALLAGAQNAIGAISSKSNPRDLVTEWDTRVEELIRDRLQELSPGVPLLAEEGGASGSSESTQRWLVDPIDGTVNFAHGLPFFAVSIALEDAGAPVVGVVNAPALGWKHYGSLGGGAFSEGGPLRVSKVAKLGAAVLATGFPYDRATTSFNFREWEHMQRTAGACRRFGAASLDLCMVARGWIDGYWESRLSPWDVAAGALLVAEAGGRTTSISGGTFVAQDGACVATNNLIHEELLAELDSVQSSSPHAS